MARKPYKPQDSEGQQVNESAAAYQQRIADVYLVTDEERTSIAKAKEQYARGEYCTQEDMDKKVAEWLS